MCSAAIVDHPNIDCPSVLFLVFNRPDLTRRVFQRIRQAQPRQLFIAADGPRTDHPGESWLCTQTRKIVDQVDWNCEVRTLFREHNLGTGRAVSSAITWFFEHVESGIILEDDCLPDPSFFPFCGELLEKYRYHEKVFEISGDNFLKGWPDNAEFSYTFSVFSLIWGWATWRRAWRYFDYSMAGWSTRAGRQQVREYIGSREIYARRARLFDQTLRGEIDAWDYRWTCSCWLNQGLSIHPKVNLVSNIGFDERATHTFDRENPSAALPTKSMSFPLVHPEKVQHNAVYDKHLLCSHFTPQPASYLQPKAILRDILPPILYRMLASTYGRVVSVAHPTKRHPSIIQNSPEWHVVSDGVLSGLRLFVTAEMPAFHEMIEGRYDQAFWDYLANVDLTGQTIIDVGGHIGYHSLGFSKLVGHSGHVYTFEPNPYNAERMRMILGNNQESAQNISVCQSALSDRCSPVEFHISANVDDQTSSGSFIEGSHLPLNEAMYYNAGFFTISTSTITLDKFVIDNDVDNIALIKIDVEGAELQVLRGANKTIKRYQPLILLEVHSPSVLIDICTHLTLLGYRQHLVEHDGSHRFFVVGSIGIDEHLEEADAYSQG